MEIYLRLDGIGWWWKFGMGYQGLAREAGLTRTMPCVGCLGKEAGKRPLTHQVTRIHRIVVPF